MRHNDQFLKIADLPAADFLFVGVFFAVLNGAISAFNGVVDAAKGAIEAVKGLLDVMERVGGYFVQFVNYIWPGNSSQSR